MEGEEVRVAESADAVEVGFDFGELAFACGDVSGDSDGRSKGTDLAG